MFGRQLFRRLLLIAAAWAALNGWAALYGFAAPEHCQGQEKSPHRFEFEERHMGMPVKILLYADDESAANTAAKAAYARIAQLDATLSDYQDTSELSRLSATSGSGEAVPIGDDLWRILAAAQALSERSNGAFDITVGPIVRLWRRARRQKKLPDESAVSAAAKATGHRHIQLDPEQRTATLKQPGMRLDPGGIAAGYAVDEALAVLKKHGITRASVDASGDIGCGDPPPGKDGWRIGVAPLEADGPPSQILLLANAAVTTSGDAFQYVEIDGVRYSHIVDPRTGSPLTRRSSVSVVARTCLEADSLATAASVLGAEQGLELIQQTAGAAAFFVERQEENTITRASDAWQELLVR